MSRLASLLHLDDGEFPALRAEIESKPLPAKLRKGVPAPRPPLPLGAPARSVAVLAELRAEAPAALFDALDALNAPTPPLLQIDFAAWLANDWTHVNARLDNLDDALGREFARWSTGAEYASSALVSPVLAEVADLTKVRLSEWRRALALHAEAELALYGAKAEVA